MVCGPREKILALVGVVRGALQPGSKVLVFVRTKRSTEYVAKKLREAKLPAETLHSDKTQYERDAVLAKFKRVSTMLLVATDVAQRGLDVKGVTVVVNFDLPDRIEDYVHRIGRTGRAGAKGKAISLCAEGDILLPELVEMLGGSAGADLRALASCCFGGQGGGAAEEGPVGGRYKMAQESPQLTDEPKNMDGLTQLLRPSGVASSAAETTRLGLTELPCHPERPFEVRRHRSRF